MMLKEKESVDRAIQKFTAGCENQNSEEKYNLSVRVDFKV
jgi:hypothetical protein